ncbi:MAG: O-antigen ligase family protein [Chitinophagaceae bacterium]|nr:O-antigen ligase family protein [Chitinophagaceae bacterium]
MQKLYLKYISLVYFPLLLFFSITFTNGELPLAITVKKYCEIFLAVVHFSVTALCFFELPRLLKIIAVGVFLHFFYIMFLSYWEYNTFFMYPHVFNKVLVPLGVCCSFLIIHRMGYKLETVIKWIYILLFIKIVYLFVSGEREGFRWGGDYRIINSMEAGMLLIPFIHYSLLYISKKEGVTKALFPLVFIFIAQHRTVWIAATLAIIIILLKYPKVIGKFALTVCIVAVAAIYSLQGLFDNKFMDELYQQVEDIQKFREQGNGGWRMEQNEFFLSRIFQKPILGWDLQAFEFGDIMEVEGWEEKGTHIHSAYIDHAYYFGLYGLVLLYMGFFVLARKIFRTNEGGLVFCIYAACMFSFGTSYQLPAHAYFFCGWGLTFFYPLYRRNAEDKIKLLNTPLAERRIITG